jgi:hypothetical protein
LVRSGDRSGSKALGNSRSSRDPESVQFHEFLNKTSRDILYTLPAGVAGGANRINVGCRGATGLSCVRTDLLPTFRPDDDAGNGR